MEFCDLIFYSLVLTLVVYTCVFDVMDEYEIIKQYFWEGFRYRSILRFLAEYHDIHISYITLRRRLRHLGLSRRMQAPPLVTVWNLIHTELQGPGRLGGYRTMCRLLRQRHQVIVPHHTVRSILRQMDPAAVLARRQHRLQRRTYTSRGPNDMWHIDGYDKLRPYGILISGCIDGYSRRIIWLKASSSNHRPGLIARYFLDSVQQLGGHPARVRTDCGTENNTVAAIQCLVVGDTAAHIYGTSPGNQRIEAWWAFFRRYRIQWWIELFENLVSFGAFHPGCEKEVECLRYCFMNIIQTDLNAVRHHWNTHRIRPSAGARCPPGVPDELFYIPEPPAVNCLVTATSQLPQQLTDELEEPRQCDSSDFQAYLDYLCSFHNWQKPTDADTATSVYFSLVALI